MTILEKNLKQVVAKGGIKSKVDAMRKAGYSPRTARTPKKAKVWPKLLDEYLPDDKLLTATNEALEAVRKRAEVVDRKCQSGLQAMEGAGLGAVVFKCQVPQVSSKQMKTKLGRPKLRPYKNLRKQAWDLQSEYVRREARGVCFTCGDTREWKLQQAGHYIHLNALDFVKININCQCVKCNKYLSGNTGVYAERLIKKYGIEAVEEIRNLPKVRKYQRWELENFIEYYKERNKEL